MEEDKDIKILEEILKDIEADKNKACYVDRDSLIFPIIKNLIATYKELEKEKLSKSGIYKIDINLKEDYIPKSKVKEKIEKYKLFEWNNRDDKYWANRIIAGIEELLED